MASTSNVRYNDWLAGTLAGKFIQSYENPNNTDAGGTDLASTARRAQGIYNGPDAAIINGLTQKFGTDWTQRVGRDKSLANAVAKEARKLGVDEQALLSEKGWWQQGFRPGMDLVRYDGGNLLQAALDVATPIAQTAGVGLSLGAAGGALGLAGFPGVGAVPSLSASFGETLSGLGGGASAGAGSAAAPASAFEASMPGSWSAAANQASPFGFGGTLSSNLAVAPQLAGTFGAGSGGSALAGSPTVSQSGSTLAPAGTGTAGSASGAASVFDNVLSSPQLLGMGAGALMGGMGGGSEPAGTTTTETDMPDWLKAYVKPTLDKYSTMVQNYNTDPYGIMPAAMDQFRKTVSGDFLDPSTNKYLEGYFNAGAERLKGTLSPSFGHMQAFGGHAGYNEALSRGLADLSTGLYGQAYENERSRMNSAIGAAPSFLQGASQQQFAPYQGYLSTLGSLKGSKTTQPYFEGSDWQNILGGAMTGWGLGNMFKT